MSPAIRELSRSLIRGLIPYPDPLKRRRIRIAARRLVRCDPWPGNDASPLQLSELCLLHALWLQRETHRAVRLRQAEAAALLARASIETCILGMYCQVIDDPILELSRANSRAFGNLMQYLVDSGNISTRLIEIAQKAISDAEMKSLKTFEMVKTIITVTGQGLAMDLYRRQYVPLSTFFAHANGLVLFRHVGTGGKLSEEPSYPWIRRSAVRACDASVGVLAAAVCEKSDLPREDFLRYANDHMRRSLTPVFAIGLRNASGTFHWSQIGRLISGIRAAVKYANSVEFKMDSAEIRTLRARAQLTDIFGAFNPGDTSEVRDQMIDVFAEMIATPEPSRGSTGH